MQLLLADLAAALHMTMKAETCRVFMNKTPQLAAPFI